MWFDFFVILQFWDLQFCNFAIPRPRDFVILWFCHFVILSFLDFAIWAIAISEIHNEINRKHAISMSRACKCNENINKEHWKSIFVAWLYSFVIIRFCNFEVGQLEVWNTAFSWTNTTSTRRRMQLLCLGPANEMNVVHSAISFR